LSSSGYQPTASWNFLKNWNTTNPSSPVPYPNTTNIPVTYVSLTEARLYCEWSGKRLPHSYEWQAAGQGANTNVTEWLYPWGPQLNQSLFPVQQSGRNIPGAPPVGNYSPQGDSPFGVSDMVGSVWQYTDEFRDIHTRGVVLRGTSNYRPAGSGWYFRNALVRVCGSMGGISDCVETIVFGSRSSIATTNTS
jgi:gamma-glutamyl hercynylcysteine S-oxide synthase